MPVSPFLRGVVIVAIVSFCTGAALTYAVVRNDVADQVRFCDEYVEVLLKEFGEGDRFGLTVPE